MDSDYEERSRDEELSKLRSCSASPSALSTASSGSPLVRGSSGGSNKRPAPTSIAAAQLQCQQQRQLEFANQMLAGGGSGSKKSAGGSQGSSKQWQVSGGQKPPSYSSQGSRNPSSKETRRSGGMKSDKLPAVGGKSSEAYDDTKSRGYNVAKSIAYRAYRFNEFWSVNKMRYMNLACLLMTLLCLVTILLLSGNNNSNTAINNAAPPQLAAGKTLQEKLAARKSHLFGDESASESFDSLDSQPLQSSVSQQVSPASNDNQLFDDFSLFSTNRGAAKFRRKSELDSGPKAASSVEREVEESTGPPSEAEFERPKSRLNGLFGDNSAASSPTGGSLIDLLLGQLFSNDMELGSLYKAIRRAANGTSGSGLAMSPPVIRRSKNGATIIISSSSLAKPSSLNDSSTSSLLDKLLPPIFRPISSPLSKSADGNSSGVATITIGAEPIFASSSSSGPPAVSRLLGPTFASLDPFGAGQSSGQRGSSLFMEPPMGFRSPFGPMFSPPPVAFPPPALLSMMMRMSALEGDQLEPLGFASKVERVPAPANAETNNKSADKNDTLTTQASQQISSNATQQALKNDSKSPAVSFAAEPDVETFDLSRPYRMHNFYPRARPSGSMLVFSSGGSESPRDSFPFSPLMALPPPQMMLIGSGGGGALDGQAGPLSPVLKTILSNVMSDLASPDQADKNKTDRNSQGRTPRTSSSNHVPHWSTLPELDGDDWPAGAPVDERWDEQAQSKHLRARHRDEEMDSAAEASDFVTGLQLDQSQGSPFGSMLDSGIVSGTIRQTIRGPGMSVERIIEVPSSRVQHVAAGVRSQSLSRSDLDESAESSARPTLISGSPFIQMRPAMADRMSSDDFAGPMPLGFISRLLSDISRRSEQPNRGSSSQMMKSRVLDDDLDEGDSGRHQDGWPKIRLVGGVRIKTHRPVGAPQADAIVMPSNQFSSQAEAGDEKESQGGASLMTGESKLGSSFEDTMNSMEDRLNHVLSVASQHSLGLNHKQSDEPEISAKPAGIVPIQRNHQAPTIMTPVEPEKQQSATAESLAKRAPSGNPFTSPSSPLFGFPASSMIQQAASETVAKSKQSGASESSNLGSARQQRSFTYHSNNEVASSILPAAKRDHPSPIGSDSIARTRFIPLQSPPASVVMGRRLDDGPSHESSAIDHHRQHQNHQAAVPANFEDRNKLFGEARGFISSAGANEGPRTIVV